MLHVPRLAFHDPELARMASLATDLGATMYAAPTVTVYDTHGNILSSLNILQGSTVTDDRSQAMRRSCDLKVADPNATLVASSGTSLLATGSTSGNTIVVTSAGSQLGTFVVQISDPKDTGDERTVEMTGYDESWLLTRPQFSSAWVVGAGTPWAYAFADLISEYLPNADLSNLANINWPTPAITLNPGDEPWTDMATEWAPAVGCELYFGVDGKVYLTAVPDPRTQTPSWVYAEGDPGTMTMVEHEFDDSSAPNAWQRDGVGPGNQTITATVFDENPNSSSYARGGYGYILDYKQDPLVSSQEQCTNDATAQFYLGLGANEPVILSVIPNPGLRVGQVMQVTREASGLEDSLVVIDTIVHSFYPGDTTQITGRHIWPWPDL